MLRNMKRGMFIAEGESGRQVFDKVYGREAMDAARKLVEMEDQVYTREEALGAPGALQGVEVILTTWGCPRLDAGFLAAAPDLEAVFYAAGSVRGFTTPEFWKSDIRLCSAVRANAVPVAEYSFATILLSLKQFWRYARADGESREQPREAEAFPGGFRTPVGLVSIGIIGAMVAERLRTTDLRVLAFDPFLAEAEAGALGLERCDLAELFRTARVISLHTPWLKDTEGLVTGELVASMPAYGTLINTARGAIIREDELVQVLVERPDLTAILDVTHPEPPRQDSLLRTLPNVILTPHIAGSYGPECRRMGQFMVDELGRYVAGEPLQYEVPQTPEHLAGMA